ncbi:MAG: PepSY domain-containing protein [Aridibacter sp.]
MKKNVLVACGLLILLVSTGVVFGNNVSVKSNNLNIIKQAKITIEQARKIALKKVDGKIEDEYTIENEDETVISFVFVIKNKAGKSFEVQVDADDGEIISAEEQIEDSDEENQKPPQFNGKRIVENG